MSVPSIGDVLRSIRDGNFDGELQYIVQQAYLRRSDITGEYLFTHHPNVQNDGLVMVEGVTTPGMVLIEGEQYEEIVAGSLQGVRSLVQPHSFRPIESPGGEPYFTHEESVYLKSPMIGRVFTLIDFGAFHGCLVKIEKIAKVNFHGRVLTRPANVGYDKRARRMVAAAEKGSLFQFPMASLAHLLD